MGQVATLVDKQVDKVDSQILEALGYAHKILMKSLANRLIDGKQVWIKYVFVTFIII